MKKHFLLFLATLLVLTFSFSALTGCQQPGDSSSDIVSDSSTKSEVPSDSSAEESDNESADESVDESSDEPLPPQENLLDRYGQGYLPEQTDIPSYCSSVGGGYYDTGIEYLSQEYNFEVKDSCLLARNYYENVLEVADLKSGERLYSISFDGYQFADIISGGEVLLVKYDGMEITKVSRNGEKSVIREADGEHVGPDSIYYSRVTNDEMYLYYESNTETEQGAFNFCNLKTGELSSIRSEDYPYGSYLDSTEDGQIFDLYNGQIGLLKPEEKTMDIVYSDVVAGNWQHGIYTIANFAGVVLGFCDDPGMRLIVPSSDFGYMYVTSIVEGVLLGGYDYSNKSVPVCNLRQETMGSIPSPKESQCIVYSEAIGGGIVLIGFEDAKGHVRLYLYNLLELETEHFDVFYGTQEQIAADIDQLKAEVADLGIEIYTGSQGNDFQSSGYVGLALLDDYDVFLYLRQVVSLIKKYPDGMLREAWESAKKKGIRLYLCGTLYGAGGGLDTAGAVAFSEDGYLCVAFDCRQNSMQTNLPHEFSHMFDTRIGYVFEKTGRDWIAEFEALTPYEYALNYDNYYKLHKFTFDNENNPENVWYIDEYSRTFSTEDRARIMENLWNADDEYNARYFKNDHIREKAVFYCYMLRQCFTSLQDYDGVLPWETVLPPMNEYKPAA